MEPTKETGIDARIALIYTNVEKLVKHFKLDRRAKNNPDDPTENETSADDEGSRMLRDILERINNISKTCDRKEFTAEQSAALWRIENTIGKALRDYNNGEFSKLETAIGRIEQAVDILKAEKQDSVVHHYHRHSIDDIEIRVFGIFVALTFGLLVSIIINFVQLHKNGKFRDNDLKYRYIQMLNEATPEDIMQLREVFEFHRDKNIIRNVRRQVEDYEQLVKQEAENAAKARFNANQAERLKKQAEKVKGGK